MSIHTDQATVDRWLADGRWVEFAPGNHVAQHEDKADCTSACYDPPADWQQELCETCDGYGYGLPHDAKFEGLLRNGGWTDELRRDFEVWVADESVPCHFCVQRLAVTVPCPHDCERFGGKVPGYARGSNWAWVPCWCEGTFRITVPGITATVEWGPTCIVRDHEMMSGDFLFVGGDNCLHGLIDNREVHTGSLPPDIDPQSLVGQWARGGTIEVVA